MSARRPAASSGSPSTPAATRRTAWRCRRANSTSAARKRRPTSARRRRFWPTSRRCTPSTTAPPACARLRPRIHATAVAVDRAVRALGFAQANSEYFDTLWIEGADAAVVRRLAEARGINFRYDASGIGIAFDETVSEDDAKDVVAVFAEAAGKAAPALVVDEKSSAIPPALEADVRVSHAPDVQHASLRDRDDALHQVARAQGCRARYVDDSARLVHDEAECGVGDDPGVVAGVRAPSIRSLLRSSCRATPRSSASSRPRCAALPASMPCRCSRTRARRASSPA